MLNPIILLRFVVLIKGYTPEKIYRVFEKVEKHNPKSKNLNENHSGSKNSGVEVPSSYLQNNIEFCV